jgi:hypothetical protein
MVASLALPGGVVVLIKFSHAMLAYLFGSMIARGTSFEAAFFMASWTSSRA